MASKELLAPKMRAYAATHPGNDHLIKLADEMEAAYSAPPESWNAKRVLGTWARARRAWCAITGEDLV